MKTKFILVFLINILSAIYQAAYAQQSLVCNLDELLPQKSTGLLFEIQMKDRPVSYLFGTMHTGYKRFQHLPTNVRNAIAASQFVVVEGNVTDLYMKNTREMYFLSNGVTLKNKIRGSTYQQLQKSLDTLGYSAAQKATVDRWTPLNVTTIFDDYPPLLIKENSLDELVDAEAYQNKIETIGLESDDELMGGFRSISIDEWSNLLEMSIEESKSTYSKLERKYYQYCLYEAMRVGDPVLMNTITESFQKHKPEEAIYKFKISTIRNPTQTKNIIQLIKDNHFSYFFSIGAMHLVGESGLIKLLANYGLKVKQIR